MHDAPPTLPLLDPALPIGVFDSGVGGLTVTRAIAALLPHEKIIYLGDTARVPYGNRGADTVRRYALNATRLLLSQRIKALVIACNTATAHGLEALRQAHPDLPILGVIDPVARQALLRTTTGSIAVIGTRGTIQSSCYPRALTRLAADLSAPQTEHDDAGVEATPPANRFCADRIAQIACPLFVPLAEEGWVEGDVPEQVAMRYLQPLKQTDVDTLILGCTHYPMLRDTIAVTLDAIMPRYVTLLDCAQSTAQSLKALLAARGLSAPHTPGDAPLPTKERISFLVTDEPAGFMATAIRFFGGPINRPRHVDIPMEDHHDA